MLREYQDFSALLPALSNQKDLTPDELLFADFNLMVTEYIAALREMTPVPASLIQAVA